MLPHLAVLSNRNITSEPYLFQTIVDFKEFISVVDRKALQQIF